MDYHQFFDADEPEGRSITARRVAAIKRHGKHVVEELDLDRDRENMIASLQEGVTKLDQEPGDNAALVSALQRSVELLKGDELSARRKAKAKAKAKGKGAK